MGLWAVKVAHQKPNSKMYTYGVSLSICGFCELGLTIFKWQRAETLGALVNGVFLVALCMSIFLEAIQRFFEPQEVANPKSILIIGCFGLLSNILGLLLFHEHGHSHGRAGHGHSHGAAEGVSNAEEGQHTGAKNVRMSATQAVADESGNVVNVLPQTTVAGLGSGRRQHGQPNQTNGSSKQVAERTADFSTSPVSFRKSSSSNRRHSKQTSRSKSRFTSVEDILIHPASFRNEIIAAGRLEDIDSRADSEFSEEESDAESNHSMHEETPLLTGNAGPRYSQTDGNAESTGKYDHHKSWHAAHKHSKPKKEASDLNMKGVFLHVIGDALGNIGVIASALIIWLTNLRGRFYADPAISLIITFIILGSAIPLCKAASRILLQAVPQGINIDELKEDIAMLPGVVSCHHLHVWQLSDVKLVASLHIEVGFDFKGEGSARYMELARQVQRCLHEYGIHESTIQPEFCLDPNHSQEYSSDNEEDGKKKSSSKHDSRAHSRAPSLKGQPEACLLRE